jgi:hypothetical protein
MHVALPHREQNLERQRPRASGHTSNDPAARQPAAVTHRYHAIIGDHPPEPARYRPGDGP